MHLRLNTLLRSALDDIEPSIVCGVSYYPVAVETDAGEILECVYLAEENGYYGQWGVWPEQDSGKRSIKIEKVLSVSASVKRLPWKYAKVVYDAGESGMGYHLFTVRFKNGVTQVVLDGGGADFIEYPVGLSGVDVSAVLPHVGRESPAITQSPSYYWCLYSK